MKLRGARPQKLVCDACHYMEDIDRLHTGLINRECPDCQSIMLTAEDYRIAKRMMWKITIFEWLSRMVTKMYPAAFGLGTMSVQVKDGQASTEFKEGRRP